MQDALPLQDALPPHDERSPIPHSKPLPLCLHLWVVPYAGRSPRTQGKGTQGPHGMGDEAR